MKKLKINLQTVLIALSMMAVLSFAIGGYLYYSSLTKFSEDRSHKDAAEQLRDMGNDIDAFLAWSLLSVKSMAGLKELKHSLLIKEAAGLSETNSILDQFCNDLNVNVCYLMDRSGNTIASSNRNDPDSFVGKNYGFRPYFQQAMDNLPAVYMALGVTSKERGIYYSHPVYEKNRADPLGAAVIKVSAQRIEKEFKKPYQGSVVLIDPHGVIFVSSRTDWLYHVLWETPPEKILEIAETGQFGNGPWNWTGLKRTDLDNAVDARGNGYRVHRQGLANCPGWQLVYLHSYDDVMKAVTDPLRKSVGSAVILLCIFFGLIVVLLFIRANTEIIQRKTAEMEQKLSLSKLKATLESTADGILVVDRKGKTSAFNKRFAEMWEIPEHVLESRDDESVMAYVLDRLHNPDAFVRKVTELYADPAAESFDTLQFKDGQIFERYSRPQNLNDQIVGRVWSFRDVTQINRVQKEREDLIEKLQNTLDELKTLRGILPICSSCKKIRDDRGSWNQIESYIRDHSAAEFSHSICPECSDRLYGDQDWYIEMKKEENLKE